MTRLAARRDAARWQILLASALAVALLAALVATGRWPELRGKVSFAPKGLVSIAPAEIGRVEIRAGSDSVAFHRQSGRWSLAGREGAVPAELASHLDTALRFANVSEPVREIPAAELTAESFAEFGLDPPASVAVLETQAGGVAATVNFGSLNPAGTSHYVRLGGAPTVYLMSRHVGAEWRVVFDMAHRLQEQAGASAAGRGPSLLLPVSLAQVWAIEIAFAGKLTRFERDAAGNWFRHVGQHTHTGGSNVHVADPAQARLIDTAFRAFDAAAIERRIGPGDAGRLAQYGLALPSLIVLLYARDNSTALARLEIGAAADSLDRYARLAPDGAVVTVAEFEIRRLTELLKAVGAGS
ncbi:MULTISPECIES: DUF4340 domain-containing protein [unclassified Bradyrhizobium]|uniref:DUF4340 domain-containing protein n=1 Tax=unclassified Bradyrhizobium TaxID=2631580 RepID=UPI00247A93AD|nr:MULTISPECIES: DUF4340 domain-containing protein [unclassified Bradyrhizobium]WGS22965.1 DUF4340 domain-containing protein [Bradyrhizobium sp. ISRA463]WGS29967.1 DUF4340 domain-containing protein [Bradyrhizobium sp. ISRA464]